VGVINSKAGSLAQRDKKAPPSLPVEPVNKTRINE
jgi:hypothetical protein